MIVYVLQNNKKLDERHFLKYMSKKIEKTEKKFNVKPSAKVYCLDDAAIDIISSLMSGKKPLIKKSAYLFCLRKELEIYARLRKIKLDFVEYKGLKKHAKSMLDEMEQRHKEIKYSILRAYEGLESI